MRAKRNLIETPYYSSMVFGQKLETIVTTVWVEGEVILMLEAL